MLTIELSGWTLLLILMALGGYYLGWKPGIRAFLTVTLVSALGYLIFVVNAAQPVLDYVNNIYTNIPKLIAIFTGSSPDAAAAWPAINLNTNLPLPVRVVLYIAFVVLAWIFNTRPSWYSNKPTQLSRQLGVFSGALTVLIWVSALTTFWQEAVAQGSTLAASFSNIIGVFPDVTPIAPWLITLLFIIVLVGIALNLPKLWRA